MLMITIGTDCSGSEAPIEVFLFIINGLVRLINLQDKVSLPTMNQK